MPVIKSSEPTPLRLGTRASALARWQANWVAEQLRTRGTRVDLVPITTQGDVDQQPISQLASPGAFTKELQRALLEERVDLAVHSLKDLPTEPIEGLRLAAVPPREDVADVLISRSGLLLDQLPKGAILGTASLRRRAQLLHLRGDLVMRDIRGNVDTRLRKLEAGEFDAIVLALAGLKRLELADRITQVLPVEVMLPAVGQGALGIETRAVDPAAQAALAPLDDPQTHACVLAERSLLAALRGGCLAPVAAWCRPAEAGQLTLSAAVLSHDGSRKLAAQGSAAVAEAIGLGQQVAAELLAAGAASLIAAARDTLGR